MSETKVQNQVLIITVPRESMTEKEKGDAKRELDKHGLIAVFVEFDPKTVYPPRFDKVFV